MAKPKTTDTVVKRAPDQTSRANGVKFTFRGNRVDGALQILECACKYYKSSFDSKNLNSLKELLNAIFGVYSAYRDTIQDPIEALDGDRYNYFSDFLQSKGIRIPYTSLVNSAMKYAITADNCMIDFQARRIVYDEIERLVRMRGDDADAVFAWITDTTGRVQVSNFRNYDLQRDEVSTAMASREA